LAIFHGRISIGVTFAGLTPSLERSADDSEGVVPFAWAWGCGGSSSLNVAAAILSDALGFLPSV